MEGWRIAHLVAVGLWSGLLLAELWIELAARRERGLQPAVIRLRQILDSNLGLLLLAAAGLTGLGLTSYVEEEGLTVVKIAIGVALLATTGLGVVVVYARQAELYREGGADPERLASLGNRILVGSLASVLLVAASLIVGGRLAEWW